MRISIGFELQTNEMSVAYESFKDTTDPIPVIYHPDTFMIHELQINQQPSIALYGDALSQDTDFKKATQTIKYLKDRYQDIILNDCEKIQMNSELNNIFNDAEFIVTYDEPTEITMTTLLTFMKKKTSDAMKNITKCIHSRGTFVPIESIKGVSKRTKRIKTQTNFPFHSFYRIQNINTDMNENQILLIPISKPNLEDFSYYIQTTLGIQLENVWEVMKLLASLVIETPKIIASEKQKARTLIIIEDKLDQDFPESRLKKNKLPRILYLLFVYSFIVKKSSRKADPFIIRHHFVELLKLLNKSQFNIMKSWLSSSYMSELVQKLYETPSFISIHDGKQQTQQAYMKQKVFQSVDIVKTYSIKPDGLNTMILFEFRYWNAILNHNISKKKGTHDFIKLKELID
jgi:hypothetical protein